MLGCKDLNKIADKSYNTTERDRSKDIGERRETQKQIREALMYEFKKSKELSTNV